MMAAEDPVIVSPRYVSVRSKSYESAFDRASRASYEWVQTLPLFTGRNTEFIKKLSEYLQVEVFATGQDIMREGDRGDKMYVLRRGKVSVLVGPDEKCVAELPEGAIFGEMALFGTMCRSATVRAAEFCDCRSISHGIFHVLLKKFPEEKDYFAGIAKERKKKIAEDAEKKAKPLDDPPSPSMATTQSMRRRSFGRSPSMRSNVSRQSTTPSWMVDVDDIASPASAQVRTLSINTLASSLQSDWEDEWVRRYLSEDSTTDGRSTRANSKGVMLSSPARSGRRASTSAVPSDLPNVQRSRSGGAGWTALRSPGHRMNTDAGLTSRMIQQLQKFHSYAGEEDDQEGGLSPTAPTAPRPTRRRSTDAGRSLRMMQKFHSHGGESRLEDEEEGGLSPTVPTAPRPTRRRSTDAGRSLRMMQKFHSHGGESLSEDEEEGGLSPTVPTAPRPSRRRSTDAGRSPRWFESLQNHGGALTGEVSKMGGRIMRAFRRHSTGNSDSTASGAPHADSQASSPATVADSPVE